VNDLSRSIFPEKNSLKCFRNSKPLLSRDNKNFRYFASKTESTEVENKSNENPEAEEEEERLEELMDQATQEFRSYIKNQVRLGFSTSEIRFVLKL
jgi:DNA-directed RNA polymerase specialized sigma54-like protein